MEYNEEYVRTVVKENYDFCSQVEDFQTWLKAELENNPEGFDCFFKQGWDEISEKEKTKRVKNIKNIF